MDCQSFAAETANTFVQVFDAGMGYGAVILLIGLSLGYFLGNQASKCPQ